MTSSTVPNTSKNSEIVLQYCSTKKKLIASDYRSGDPLLLIQQENKPIANVIHTKAVTSLKDVPLSNPLKSPYWWLSTTGHFLRGIPEMRHNSFREGMDVVNTSLNLGRVFQKIPNNFSTQHAIQAFNQEKKIIALYNFTLEMSKGSALTAQKFIFHLFLWGVGFAFLNQLSKLLTSSEKKSDIQPQDFDLLEKIHSFLSKKEGLLESQEMIAETKVGYLLKTYVESGAFTHNSLFEAYPEKNSELQNSVFHQLIGPIENFYEDNNQRNNLLESIRKLNMDAISNIMNSQSLKCKKIDARKNLIVNDEEKSYIIKQLIRFVVDYASISTLGRLMQIITQESRTAFNSAEQSLWDQAINRLNYSQKVFSSSQLLPSRFALDGPLLTHDITVEKILPYFQECREFFFEEQPDVKNRIFNRPRVGLIKNHNQLMDWLSSVHAHRLNAEFLPPITGPAIFALNHSLYTFDISMAINQMESSTGRYGYMMVDQAIFAIPLIKEFLFALCYRLGDRRTFVDLLTPNKKSNGHCVYVAPGGMGEAIKPKEQANKLKWEKAKGFIISHLITGAPLYLLFADNADYIRESSLPTPLQKMQDYLFDKAKLPLITMLCAPHKEKRVVLKHYLSMRIMAPPLPVQLQGKTIDDKLEYKFSDEFLINYHAAICAAAKDFMQDVINHRVSKDKIADVKIDKMTLGNIPPEKWVA